MEHLSRVPKNRIAVLIGKSGKPRKMSEKACDGTLTIDSQTGDVSISWSGDPDPIRRMKVPDVISAIGRGFSPERAVQLLDDDVFLRMYNIREWVGRQPNQTRRMRSRLIGTNGRIRTLIEEISGCEIWESLLSHQQSPELYGASEKQAETGRIEWGSRFGLEGVQIDTNEHENQHDEWCDQHHRRISCIFRMEIYPSQNHYDVCNCSEDNSDPAGNVQFAFHEFVLNFLYHLEEQ